MSSSFNKYILHAIDTRGWIGNAHIDRPVTEFVTRAMSMGSSG